MADAGLPAPPAPPAPQQPLQPVQPPVLISLFPYNKCNIYHN